MVGYICYRGTEPWGNVTRGRMESMGVIGCFEVGGLGWWPYPGSFEPA